jgi:hypothetical protein
LDLDGQGDPAKVGKQSIDFIGQVEDRPYAERQRQPGDYEVQVSQRPIAVHALENLASSDRGVAALRRLIRRSIRAVESGTAGSAATLGDDGVIGTFCQDTVWPEAQAPKDFDLRRFGAIVAEEVIRGGLLSAVERRRRLRARLADLRHAEALTVT